MDFSNMTCRYCQSSEVVLAGKSSTGKQRCKCKTCKRTFQIDYTYNAWKPGIKDQIRDMGEGKLSVRGTARKFKISPNTVSAVLKASTEGDKEAKAPAED